MTSLHEISVTTLAGVGPRTATLLSRLNIFTVEDLLFHLPLHYQDLTQISLIGTLKIGEYKLIEGSIQQGEVLYRRRRYLICRLADETGHLILRWYYFNAKQQQQLTTPGLRLRCFGVVRRNPQHGLEMIHPKYQAIQSKEALFLEDRLTPVYPTTKRLSQNILRKLIQQALTLYQQCENEELLPEFFRKSLRVPTGKEAIFYLHRPPKNASIEKLETFQHPSQRRLILEELLAQHLGAVEYRRYLQQKHAIALKTSAENNSLQNTLRTSLPFSLTNAQYRVIQEINVDLMRSIPMMRLLQGDVGSGKTVVALFAIAKAVECGYQAAIMAPTELLAEQHFQVLQQLLQPLSISVGWLSGHMSASQRSRALQNIANGFYSVVVGTHALFQANVQFSQLALIIIDEQHRFGVRQRLALKEKGFAEGCYPHQLIMTATPIPRTLAMTSFADLDISILDELPPGRKPIKTWLISNERRHELIERIKRNGEKGRQTYWVCPLIEDSEILQCEAVQATHEMLTQLLPDLRIDFIHGRLNKDIRETTMTAFKAGKIDLLVATSIIEVGVDVPKASLMVIENAERLGLAQLHQLRGRVGRGEDESHCVLLYQKPLSITAKKRLAILRHTQNGFLIAEKDLEIRGPGEWLGERQAGVHRLRIADFARDQYLLPAVQEIATYMREQHSDRAGALVERWLKTSKQYAGV